MDNRSDHFILQLTPDLTLKEPFPIILTVCRGGPQASDMYVFDFQFYKKQPKAL